MARITAGIATQPRSRDRRGDRPRARRRTTTGSRSSTATTGPRSGSGEREARRRHSRLQRPRVCVRPEDHSDLRDRLRREVQSRRRRLGTAPGARWSGSSGSRLAHRPELVILDEFDMTIINEMDVDHGLTVPLSLMFGQPEAWPCQVIPLAVNVVSYPPPSGQSLLALGKAIRSAVEILPRGPERADLGHRRHEPPAAGTARRADQRRMGQRFPRPADVNDTDALRQIPHIEYLRETGSEGIEMVMWLIMRGALDAKATSVHRHYHVPASTRRSATHLENRRLISEQRYENRTGRRRRVRQKTSRRLKNIDGVEVVSMIGRHLGADPGSRRQIWLPNTARPNSTKRSRARCRCGHPVHADPDARRAGHRSAWRPASMCRSKFRWRTRWPMPRR